MIRRCPAPDSVTRPPPSRTTRATLLRTLAVALNTIVTGAGPQLNVMIPPAATALTTAAEVQLAPVPAPTTWSGWLVSTGRASAGTVAWPLGLPACSGGAAGGVLCDGLALGLVDGGVADAELSAEGLPAVHRVDGPGAAQPATRRTTAMATPVVVRTARL